MGSVHGDFHSENDSMLTSDHKIHAPKMKNKVKTCEQLIQFISVTLNHYIIVLLYILYIIVLYIISLYYISMH